MSRSLLLALLLAVVISPQARSAPRNAWNGRIAFYDVTGIGSMNPDGSGQWGVELNVGDTQPAWSPDGTQLAVISRWGNNNGIVVMQPDGSGAHAVTTDGNDNGPAWSPDGRQLAFSNSNQLFAVNADGSNRHVLYSIDSGAIGRPAWSPDGSWIVFPIQSWTDNATMLGELEVSTGKEHTLLSAVYPTNPAFSPDGKLLAYASEGAIWVASADGSDPHQISVNSQWDDQPAWAPDGTSIAFERANQIWTMNPDGTNARQLTTGDSNWWPAWQPLGPPPSNCTLWGTSANDLLVGTEGNDIICGGDGNDTIFGLGGSDILRGDNGNDWLAGGTGVNYLDGGAGDDTLDGRNANAYDTLVGGPGDDTASYDGIDKLSGVEHRHLDPDLAAWQPATASSFEPTNPPLRAFDGNAQDWWNSGGWPAQWLEVDLGVPRTIALVRGISMEYPNGGSILLLGKATPDSPYRLLHAFDGPMADNQVVSFAPKKPWRNVRFLRLYVPSVNGQVGWVAWHELSVYAPKQKR
jgi:Tol biopolymer transport system component